MTENKTRQSFGRAIAAQDSNANSTNQDDRSGGGSFATRNAAVNSNVVPVRLDDREKPFSGRSSTNDRDNGNSVRIGGRDQNSNDSHGGYSRGNNPNVDDRGGDRGSNRGSGSNGYGSRSTENSVPPMNNSRDGPRVNTHMYSDDSAREANAGRGTQNAGGREFADNRSFSSNTPGPRNNYSRDDSRGSVSFGSGDQHQQAHRPAFPSSTNSQQSRPTFDDNHQKAMEAQEKCKKAAAEINKILFDTREFSDVVLIPEVGVEIPAHKIILAARSSVFREILFGPKMAMTDEEKSQAGESVDANATVEAENPEDERETEKSESGEADEDKVKEEAGDDAEKENEVASDTEEGQIKEKEKEENALSEDEDTAEAVPKKKKKKSAKAVPKTGEKADLKAAEAVPDVKEATASTNSAAGTPRHEEVNRVELAGVFNKEVVEAFLEFVYKGESVTCKSVDMYRLVFLLAAKYKVEDVRDMAALELTKNITANTFVKLLITAAEEGSELMKTKVMDFIIKERKTVLAQDDWKRLRDDHNTLYIDVLERLARV